VANTDAFIDKLYEVRQVLGSQPVRGVRREELNVITNTIEIVRLLLGGRDIYGIFGGHAKHSDPSS
jgi:hypothetical protein